MKTLLNQFNSQIAKNTKDSISSNLISDINTVLQMANLIDTKTHSVFFSRVVSEFQKLVSCFSQEFTDYVAEQNRQEVSDKKTK